MITKIAFSVFLIGLSAGIAQAAPVSSLTATPTSAAVASDAVSSPWGIKRQAVGYRKHRFKHRSFRRGGFGFRRGGYRGYRAYRGGHRFGYRHGIRPYGYSHRGIYGGGRVRGLGTVR